MPSTGNPILDFILIILALIVLLVLGKAAIEAFGDAAMIDPSVWKGIG
jgi:hypothetical protein